MIHGIDKEDVVTTEWAIETARESMKSLWEHKRVTLDEFDLAIDTLINKVEEQVKKIENLQSHIKIISGKSDKPF